MEENNKWEKMRDARILCDFERAKDIEKTKKIQEKLGKIDIFAYVSGLQNDGLAPPAPWLKYEGITYYSDEIDDVVERLEKEYEAPATGG
jgi:hypothetical protein